jgi:hypothetical protein
MRFLRIAVHETSIPNWNTQWIVFSSQAQRFLDRTIRPGDEIAFSLGYKYLPVSLAFNYQATVTNIKRVLDTNTDLFRISNPDSHSTLPTALSNFVNTFLLDKPDELRREDIWSSMEGGSGANGLIGFDGFQYSNILVCRQFLNLRPLFVSSSLSSVQLLPLIHSWFQELVTRKMFYVTDRDVKRTILNINRGYRIEKRKVAIDNENAILQPSTEHLYAGSFITPDTPSANANNDDDDEGNDAPEPQQQISDSTFITTNDPYKRSYLLWYLNKIEKLYVFLFF